MSEPSTISSRERFLLILVALATAFLVSGGSFVSVDTARRLQVTHWMWRGAPQVTPEDADSFGYPGRNGVPQAWYGAGQSLLLLPFDVATHAAMSVLPPQSEAWRTKSEALPLSLALNGLVAAIALLAARRLLAELGFSPPQARAAALALLFATTFLHYTQESQENNLLLACQLSALVVLCRWHRAEKLRHSALAGAILGFGLLTRLTFSLDIAAVLLFALFAWRRQALRLLPGLALGLAPFVFLDRAYQFLRFGSWFSVYLPLKHGPAFNGDAVTGLLGPFFSPDNSIFLFDPLFTVGIVALAFAWPRLSGVQRAFLLAQLALLVLIVGFYCTYFTYSGEESWGDRYTTPPVQLLAMLAVPFLLAPAWRKLGRVAIVAGISLQLLSILFVPSLENDQFRAGLVSRFVVKERVLNAVSVATGRADTDARFRGQPVEWRRFSLLPFQLEIRFPALARIAFVLWAMAAAICAWALWRLRAG
jgi:hypothetical protein